jgi:SAM-dependent methyltransferase
MAGKCKIADESTSERGFDSCAGANALTGASQSLYADPTVYDILYTPGTAAEIDALERVERSLAGDRLRPDRLWFEPACGTGRCLRVAAGRGRRVAGFDRQTSMLEYAAGRLDSPRRPGTVPCGEGGAADGRNAAGRGAGPRHGESRARLFAADLADFAAPARKAGLKPGSVDFAFVTVNSLRHLPSDHTMLAHFAQMAELLRPGGLYVVGLSLTDYTWLWPDEDLWTATRGRCKVSQLINWLPPEPGTVRGRLERAISHLTVERPAATDHFDDAYDLRCYDQRQWRALLRKAPLEPVGSFNALGKPLPPGIWPYQLEALRRPHPAAATSD